jgi:hypothetical protein
MNHFEAQMQPLREEPGSPDRQRAGQLAVSLENLRGRIAAIVTLSVR